MKGNPAMSDVRIVDSKNRPVVESMTEREIMEENLILMRAFADALAVISSSPMASAMLPGFPKF